MLANATAQTGYPYNSKVQLEVVASTFNQKDKPHGTVLEYTTSGLCLWHNGLTTSPNWIGEVSRLRRASLKKELLARACQLGTNPIVLDATCGLGHDSLLMAWLGAAHVYAYEQNPWLYLLLCSSKSLCIDYAIRNNYKRLEQALQALTLHLNDSQQLLLNDALPQPVDVIYLDPMFPQASNPGKQALNKKNMQILQDLLKDAPQCAVPPTRALHHAKRVVVKRPKLAPLFANEAASVVFEGDQCRFDVYLATAVTAEC